MKIIEQRKTVSYLVKIGFSRNEATQLMRAIDYHCRAKTFIEALKIIQGEKYKMNKGLTLA
jgi:hypothetical protein